MNKKPTVQAAAKVMGLLAAIASLLFVGLELRQNTIATRLDAVQRLTETWSQWDLEMSVNREGWEAMEVVFQFEDPESAPFVDRSMALSVMRAQFQAWATWHYFWKNEVVDDAFWNASASEIRSDLTSGSDWNRVMLWAWRKNGHLYQEDFQDFMNGIVASRISG